MPAFIHHPDSPQSELPYVKPTHDLRIVRTRPLIAPAVLEEEFPVSDKSSEVTFQGRREIADIMHARDARLLVILGPCSVHDPEAVQDYAIRLTNLSRRVADELLLIMRVYFEKPRTSVGWKGYINDPDLDESFRVNQGLRGARQLLAKLTEGGIPCASEFLDTTLGQYYADFVSWGAIGARTVESQVHRQLASGLSMPVGMKNRTDGEVQVAIDAILAARRSHLFPSLTKQGAPALLETKGNEDCHLVLRGGKSPNYHAESVEAAVNALASNCIETGLIVDCSHGNSGKKPSAQVKVARDVTEQRLSGQRKIVGIMLESHLVEGRQNAPETYGMSITDACLGWEQTESLVLELAQRQRRL